VAVLHADDGEVDCRVRPDPGPGATASARDALFRGLAGRGPGEWARALDGLVGGRRYTIDDVFLDERRRLVTRLAERALEGLGGDSRQEPVVPGAARPPRGADHVDAAIRRLLAWGRGAGVPLPAPLTNVARRLLTRAAREELAALGTSASLTRSVQRIRELAAEARSLGGALALRSEDVIPPTELALARVLATLRTGVTAGAVTDGLALLGLTTLLETTPDLWVPQNAAAGLWRDGSERDRATLAPLMAALGFAPDAFTASRERG
jgi:hypothetical protein